MERLHQHTLLASEARDTLVRSLDDFPARHTLQQQWDSLPEKPIHDVTVALTERLLLPLSVSRADLLTLQPSTTLPLHSWKVIVSTDFHGVLTFIQQITASS